MRSLQYSLPDLAPVAIKIFSRRQQFCPIVLVLWMSMPRTEYPKSRRLLMQAVLFIIFGASVGMAQYVIHQRRVSGNTHLAAMRYVGQVGVQLPRGWMLVRENQGSILWMATEPDTTERKGRRITIRQQKLQTLVSSEEFLQNSRLLDGTERIIRTDPASNVAAPITIAGDSGVMLTVIKPVGGFLGFGQTEAEKVLFAASVRPSGLALSLELECPEDTDPQDDEMTLTEIAAGIDVRDSGPGR
jgi:hypothetical protein